MKTHRALSWSTHLLGGLVMLSLFLMFPASASPEESDSEPTLVGRISHLEGKLLRFDNDQEQWVEAEKDSPFGKGDALSSDEDTRAELMLPNRTWIRIGSTTQIELKELNAVETEVDLPAGTARFYNKNSEGTIKVTTPYGFVKAPRNTSFDVYTDEQAVEVVALEGAVDFVHKSGRDKYEAAAGSSSLIADEKGITSGEGLAAKGWDRWNGERDEVWARQLRSGAQSARYLPAPLQYDGYVFDEYGRWDNVYYQGGYHHFWRPVYVGVGWSPFTVGRWMTWCGDYTWVPYEPFGYTTHHYGHWVYVGNYWYWAPPLATFSVGFGSPSYFMSFGWYPGRVGWIHHHDHIGWVPLLPHEPYYSHHHWGRHCRPVHHHGGTNVHVNVRDYSYADHAVIINQSRFHDRNGYHGVRVKNVNHTTIVNNYEATPLAGSIVPRTVNRAHTPGRTLQGQGPTHGATSRDVPRGMPGLINEQSGVSVKEGAPRSQETPTVKVRTMDTLRNGSSATQKHTGPVALPSTGKESPTSSALPVRESAGKGEQTAPSRGKIHVPSKGVEKELIQNNSSSSAFHQGDRTPQSTQTGEKGATSSGSSTRAFSGPSTRSTSGAAAGKSTSATKVPQQKTPSYTRELGKGNPAASPRSQGVPMRTNQYRPAPATPRAHAETLPGHFPSSSSPRVQVQSKEKQSYPGLSGYTTAPAHQPSSHGQNRISTGGSAVRRTVPTPNYQGGFVSRGGSGSGGSQARQAVPAPSSQGGYSFRSGNSSGGSHGATVQQQYAPHGGTQGFVSPQGKSGSAGHGQSSFGGMRRK